MESKLNSRPFSTVNKMTQFPQNKTINDYLPNQLNITREKKESQEKKYYLNLSHRNAYNPFSRALKQKKLFYNKIYNRNLGNIDSLGLSRFIRIKREKINTPIRTKDFSSTRISSTNTYRRINLKPKAFQRTQEQEYDDNNKSLEYSYDKGNIKFKKDSYCYYNNIFDKNVTNFDFNNDVFIQIYNGKRKVNNISKKSSLSVSSLLTSREKIKEKNIDVNPSEIKPEKMKIKNVYIIKYGNLSNIFNKIISSSEFIRPIYRDKFINLSNNITSKFEKYNKILLEKTSDENCLKSFSNFCEDIINWQKLVVDEIHYLKNENIYLNKQQKVFEKELNVKRGEIKEINENIIKYDLNKLKQGKIEESKYEKIKNNFMNIESNYVITIYQLKNEINNLNKIIKKSKEENVSNEELKNNIKKLTDELEKNKNLVFKNEFNQKHKDILINMYIEELSHKIEESDKEKDKIKQNENKLSEEIVNLKTKIDSLNDTIKEKDILISNLQTQINENKDKSSIDEKMIPPAKTKFIVETK